MKRRELSRQAVHILYGLFVSALILALPLMFSAAILSALLVSGFLLSHYLKGGNHIPVISRFLHACEREYQLIVRPGLGPLQFTLGSLLALLLFGPWIAFLSVLVLTFGDSFSTLVGVFFGKNPLPWSKKKTFEGSLACFAASFFVSSLFLPLTLSVIIAFSASLIESLSTRFDDNILIPLAVGGLLWLLL